MSALWLWRWVLMVTTIILFHFSALLPHLSFSFEWKCKCTSGKCVWRGKKWIKSIKCSQCFGFFLFDFCFKGLLCKMLHLFRFLAQTQTQAWTWRVKLYFRLLKNRSNNSFQQLQLFPHKLKLRSYQSSAGARRDYQSSLDVFWIRI